MLDTPVFKQHFAKAPVYRAITCTNNTLPNTMRLNEKEGLKGHRSYTQNVSVQVKPRKQGLQKWEYTYTFIAAHKCQGAAAMAGLAWCPAGNVTQTSYRRVTRCGRNVGQCPGARRPPQTTCCREGTGRETPNRVHSWVSGCGGMQNS